MYQISDQHTFYVFSEKNKPVLTIASGDAVEFETMDCLSNVLQKQTDRLADTSFDKEKVNPATGPVYIEGAMPGDTLEVTIEDIRFKDRAVITCQAKYGVIGDYFDETTFRITPIQDGFIHFDEKLKIPLDPMVGVIGVTPKGKEVPTGLLGPFGANMDNTMMRKGAKLYLPIFVEGALVATGDVHAAMGDGEINCSALEAPAFVTLRFQVRKDLSVKMPMLMDERYFSVVASEETLDKAVDVSVREMASILRSRLSIPFDDISMLMSAVGHAQICQCVNELKTARYLMPLYVLNTYGFQF